MKVIPFLPLAGQLSLHRNKPMDMAVMEALIQEHLFAEGQEDLQFRACIAPLLSGLDWLGDKRTLCEALPYAKPGVAQRVNPMAIRNLAANLGFNSHVEYLEMALLDGRLLPCLFMPDGGTPLVILERTEKYYRCYDSHHGGTVSLGIGEEISGSAVFFIRGAEESNLGVPGKGWFSNVAHRFEKYVLQILLLSFVITLLALASPLMIMAVYDTAIAASSYGTLAWLFVGMGMLSASESWLRAIRARSINFAGSRLDNITSRLTFERLLYLPPAYTERATVASQIARIKDFESVKEFLTGHLAMIFLELPFTLLFIIAIGFISGMLCLVPLAILVCYLGMITILHPRMKKAMMEASRAGSVRHEFLIEYLSKLRAIRNTGSTAAFIERYRAISGMASLAMFRSAMLSQFVEIVSYVCMIAAGIATLTFGVWYAAQGVITTGALIATMILSWRVLAPLQYIFASISRLEQLKASIGQMQRLMQLPPETQPHAIRKPLDNIRGRIAFQRVGLRYSADTDPALMGVSFTIEAGEMVAIRGGNGSGKSTLCRLLIKLYQPQAGSIRIDDVDMRQLDPLQVRQAIAYVPQQVYLFRGTIAENIRLARPDATKEEIETAATEAGLMDDLAAVNHTLATQVGGNLVQLPYVVLQGISLSRALLKNSPILIFDEVNFIENLGDSSRLINTIQSLRGRKTMIFITHREDISKLADKMLVMNRGELQLFGQAQDVLNHMQAG